MPILHLGVIDSPYNEAPPPGKRRRKKVVAGGCVHAAILAYA